MTAAPVPDVTRLRVPFADVAAAGLRWALGLPERPGVASRTCVLPCGVRVELRVLGASHQVVVERADARSVSETMACDLADDDRAGPLPGRAVRDGYAFTSHVVTPGPAELGAAVRAVERRCAAAPYAVVAAFPGHPDAVTAIALDLHPAGEPDALSWETWHAYPHTGELVHTHSVLTPSAPPEVHR